MENRDKRTPKMKPFHIYSDGTHQLSITKAAATNRCQVMNCRRGPGYHSPIMKCRSSQWISPPSCYTNHHSTVSRTRKSVPSFQLPLRLRLGLRGCYLLGFLFQFVFRCLSTFVRSSFFEPIVLQGFLRRNTLIGVIYEYSFQ